MVGTGRYVVVGVGASLPPVGAHEEKREENDAGPYHGATVA